MQPVRATGGLRPQSFDIHVPILAGNENARICRVAAGSPVLTAGDGPWPPRPRTSGRGSRGKQADARTCLLASVTGRPLLRLRSSRDWQDEAASFNQRSLADADYVYV
jgi:hypothetical protein